MIQLYKWYLESWIETVRLHKEVHSSGRVVLTVEHHLMQMHCRHTSKY